MPPGGWRDPLAQLTTTERGLGWEHRKVRAALIASTPDGWPCPLCHRPMYPHSDPSSVHADHSLPRSLGGTKADRLAHAECNMSRGNGTRGRKRRPIPRPRPALPAPVLPDGVPTVRSQDW